MRRVVRVAAVTPPPSLTAASHACASKFTSLSLYRVVTVFSLLSDTLQRYPDQPPTQAVTQQGYCVHEFLLKQPVSALFCCYNM